MIDLLNLITHADSKITLSETDFINHFLITLEWDSGTAKESYLADSISRSRDAVEKNTVDLMIDSITKRLGQASARDQALELAEAIASADRSLRLKESDILRRVQDKLRTV